MAAGAKKFAPRVPLWALFLSAYLLDVIFVFLLVAGIESLMPIDPAHPNAYGGILIHAEYTHSLVGALLISTLAGWLASRRWERRGGITIAIVTFSHWILDLLVHRPDLPILPGDIGNLPLLGFGLWEFPRASMALELILILVGATLYLFGVIKLSEENRRHAWTPGLVTAALLVLLYVANTLGV